MIAVVADDTSGGENTPHVSGGGFTTPTIGTSIPGPTDTGGFGITNPPVLAGSDDTHDAADDPGHGVDPLPPNGGLIADTNGIINLPTILTAVSGTDTYGVGGTATYSPTMAAPVSASGASGSDAFAQALDLVKSQLTTGDPLKAQEHQGSPVAIYNSGDTSSGSKLLPLLVLVAVAVGGWYLWKHHKAKKGGSE